MRNPSQSPTLAATAAREKLPISVSSMDVDSDQSVSDAITLEVATTDSWQLRHPVGPDVVPFLEWRSKMTDEEWIETNAGDDASSFARLGGSS